MLGQTSGVNSANKNKKNSLHCYISANTYCSFQNIALQRFGRSPSYHCRQGHNPPPVHSAPIQNKQALLQHIFDGCQTLCNRSAISEKAKVYDQTCFLVRELIQKEDILSIRCEF
jgi:hypothetical protein